MHSGCDRSMMICFSGCFVISYILFGTNSTFSNVIYGELALLSLFFGISQGLLSIYNSSIIPLPCAWNIHRHLLQRGEDCNNGCCFPAWYDFEHRRFRKSVDAFRKHIHRGIHLSLFYQGPTKNNDITCQHIAVPEGVPGIRSLAMYRPETESTPYALAQVC